MKMIHPRYTYFLLLAVCLLLLPVTSFAQHKKNGKCKMIDANGNVTKGKMKDSLKTGVWKTYDSQKRVREVITYLKGKENGPCVYYFPDDSMFTNGSFVNGRVDGEWATYRNSGTLIHSTVWHKDTMDGPRFHNYNGYITRGEFVKGKKTGWWIESYSEAGYVDSSFWVKNKREGRTVTYRQNILRSVSYWHDGKKNGLFYEYDSLGRQTLESYYKDNTPDSTYRTYKNGVKKMEFTYCNAGRYCALGTTWKDNGKLDIVTSYDSTGNRIWYVGHDEEGNIARKTWFGKSGMMDSIYVYRGDGRIWYTMIDTATTQKTKGKSLYQKFYYPQGTLQFTGWLLDSRRVGTWYTYDTTGKVSIRMTYELGMLGGPLTAYYPNGKVRLTTSCFQNYADSVIVFNSAGKMVAQADPLFNSTIADVKNLQMDIRFRNPNEFPPENGKKAKVTLGETDKQEITPGVSVPSFPGGEDSLRTFIVRNIKYPETERRLGVQGEVKIRFAVDSYGAISEVTVMQEVSNGPGLTRATLLGVNKMPKWIPAKKGNEAQKSYYRMGVKYTLE